MATSAAPNFVRPAISPATDRKFYTGMAILIAVLVFIGFAPSYYLRAVLNGPPVPSPLVHLHGVIFTGWMVLFIVQTALVATHNVKLHRKLGYATVGWAALMLVVGTSTAIAGAARGAAPAGVPPLAFLVVPLFDMLTFAIFIGAAVWQRNNKEAHKRLMLLGYISIATAGIARLPGVLTLGPLGFFGLTDLLLVGGIAYDYSTRRRIHPVYLWGGALLVASQIGRLALSGTDAWLAFARAITS